MFFTTQFEAHKDYGLFEQELSSEEESDTEFSEDARIQESDFITQQASYAKVEKELTQIVNKANIESHT